MQIYPDEGLILLLKLIAHNAGVGLTWQLFDSNTKPDLDSILADFSLASATWAQTVLDETDFTLEQVLLHNGAIQAPRVTFTNTTGSPQVIYGYVVYDSSTQVLVAASRDLDAPVTIAAGGTYHVTPSIGDYSDTSIPDIDGGTF